MNNPYIAALVKLEKAHANVCVILLHFTEGHSRTAIASMLKSVEPV